MKTCNFRDRSLRQKTDLFTYGGISAQKGAREVSCLEIYRLAAVWRSMLKDLPQRDRARDVRKQGSIMMIELEDLTRAKERRLYANTTKAGMSMHSPSGRPWAT